MLTHLQSDTVNYSQLAGFFQELFDFLGKNLTLIGAVYSRHFENKSIVLGKTTNDILPAFVCVMGRKCCFLKTLL